MFKKIATLSILVTISSAAFAVQSHDFYAGAEAGRTRVSGFSERDTSFGVFAGYRFHQDFAVEAGFRRLADFDYRFGAFSSTVRADQLSLSVVGTLPLGERFGIYGRVGINQLNVKGSSGGFDARDDETGGFYGVGLRFALTPGVFARLEVQRPASEATNLSAGLAFQF